MSILSLQDYKDYAGITSPNTDTKLQFIVDSVNEFIETFCNTKFAPIIKAGVRVTNSGATILVPEAPLISVEAVNIVSLDGSTTVIDPSNYYTFLEEGVIEIINPTVQLPTTSLSISVDYTTGYSVVPSAVVLAALELVTHYHKREFNKSRNLGNGESMDYNDPEVLPVHIRSQLDVYRVL